MSEQNANEMRRIRTLLQNFDTAMLITHGDEYPFHARPMAIARVEANCDLWFFTGRSTAMVHEIQNDQHVLIVCQDEMSRYIAVNAKAKIIFDRIKAVELWKESYTTWFPEGVCDPNVVLIRAHTEHVEYWDTGGFRSVKYLFEAARAYVRGTRPHVEEGEQHGTVTFSE